MLILLKLNLKKLFLLYVKKNIIWCTYITIQVLPLNNIIIINPYIRVILDKCFKTLKGTNFN